MKRLEALKREKQVIPSLCHLCGAWKDTYIRGVSVGDRWVELRQGFILPFVSPRKVQVRRVECLYPH